MPDSPRLLVTMGDVAGIGPEIIARAWPDLLALGRPLVVGDPGWMTRALQLVGADAAVDVITHSNDAQPSPQRVPCLAATQQDLQAVRPGEVSAAAGRAAYDFLCEAIRLALADAADAIVTCPLHKEGLHAAGVPYPGHTEILAARTGAKSHAMLLHGDGLTVAHVTLHMALRAVFANLGQESVRATIDLLDGILPKLLGRRPRIGVCALNPHASDGGLFGDEEERVIAPAVAAARHDGVDVTGPIPSDALWVRAAAGEFDGIVAMYHDQGHIPMKMRSGRRAVNITAGLPIVRTSVAHGTAYDIAGKGIADASSLVEAARVAAKLVGQSG
jgi:4-hydroxythreonine-4-phosphate dehydrogenase